MSTPVMDVEDVEQRARHEGAAKALRDMADGYEVRAKRTALFSDASVYGEVARSLYSRAAYHESFLK